MDELKEKKLDILYDRIKELSKDEQQEQITQPSAKKKAAKKAPTADLDSWENDKKIRKKKGMLVQLMYYIRKQHFNSNQE